MLASSRSNYFRHVLRGRDLSMSAGGRGTVRGQRDGSPQFRGHGDGGPSYDRGRGNGGSGFDRGRGRGGSFGGRGRGMLSGNTGGPRRGMRGGRRGDGGPVLYDAVSSAKPDARVSRPRLSALLQRLKGLDSDTLMPVRRTFGAAGKEAVVRTNYIAMKLPTRPILEYRASIEPKPESKRIRIALMGNLLAAPILAAFKDQLAHDHAERMYAATPLPVADDQALEIPLQYHEPGEGSNGQTRPPKEYILRLNFVREHDPSLLQRFLNGDPELKNWDSAPTLTAYNIILSQAPLRAGGFRIGKTGGDNKYFFPTSTAPYLGGGIVALQGFFLSVRPAIGSLMANVNVATMAFYTAGPLAESLAAFRRDCPGGNPDAFLSSLRVETIHTGFIRTIRKLLKQKADQFMFDYEGEQISVAQYFKKKCKITLKNPAGECVDVGQPGKPIVIPIELCRVIDGQAYRNNLTGNQTSAMLQTACQPPAANARRIMSEGVSRLGLDGNSAVANGFGVKFEEQLATVPSRVLASPAITYANNAVARVTDKASWNLANVKLARAGTPIDDWGVLMVTEHNCVDAFTGPQDMGFTSLIRAFTGSIKQYGVDIAEKPFAIKAKLLPRDPEDRIRRASIAQIRKQIAARRPKLLLVLLANDDNFIYGGIKQLCDVELGIPTICAQTSLIANQPGQQYMANLTLKVNAKMGGFNHVVKPDGLRLLHSDLTMVVGVDVTHPSPNSEFGAPSIAAVVASIDDTYAQLPASLRLQRGTKEMIFTELTEMMAERLALFRSKNNNKLPARVVVFRDGVSEGQFKQVLDEELAAIRAACSKFSSGSGKAYAPKLSIIICAKRHQTRFFPTEQETGGDENGNTRPGTMVDVGVSTIFGRDFFLQSHYALLGTARPTHYYPIYDELGWDADDWQKVINTLSWDFARATKAISLVTPAYAAHLAAERGRCYLREYLDGRGSDEQSVDTKDREVIRDHKFERAKRDWGQGVHERLKDSMFYL